MKEYKLGKEIQKLKQKIQALERVFDVESQRLFCKKSIFHVGEIELVSRVNEEGFHATCKTNEYGRKDAGECEVRKQTIKVCPDGTFEHYAEYHNHSRFPDDGDTHKVHAEIRAGSEVIHSFTNQRFVPRGKRRSKTVGRGIVVERIRERYGDIDTFDVWIECS